MGAVPNPNPSTRWPATGPAVKAFGSIGDASASRIRTSAVPPRYGIDIIVIMIKVIISSMTPWESELENGYGMYGWREDIQTDQKPGDRKGKGRCAKLHPNPRRRDLRDGLSCQGGVRPGHRPGCARLQHEPSPQCVEASRLYSETGLGLARASHSR